MGEGEHINLIFIKYEYQIIIIVPISEFAARFANIQGLGFRPRLLLHFLAGPVSVLEISPRPTGGLRCCNPAKADNMLE